MSAQKAAARGTSRHDTTLQDSRGRPASRPGTGQHSGREPRGRRDRSRRAAEHLARPARPGGARDGLPCGGPVTAAAARRVIDAFSLPGNLVAAAGGSPAVIKAAAAAGRRVLALAPGPAPGRQRPGVPAALPPPATPPPGRPGWPSPAAAAPAAAAGSRAARTGRTPGWCSPPASGCCAPAGSWRLSPAPPPPAARRRTAGSVVAAARAAGLVYAQHIVLVHAAIDGDRLAPAAAPARCPPRPAAARVHDDLLVFTKPGGGARS